MKKIIAFFIFIIPVFLNAQLQSAGLQGMNIYSLAQYGDAVYVGTDDGVYWIRPHFSYWRTFGLQGKKIKSVYPHQYGAIGTAITVSVLRDSISSNEPLIYCTSDLGQTWIVKDSGIVRNDIPYLKDINGFPSPLICGETFAGGFGKLYRRDLNSPTWEKVFDIGIGQLNVVEANQQTADVWVGGETTIFAPYISKSEDKGKTWLTFYPNLNGDNACNSILFDDNDTNIVYAGMEGSVIKSTDRGETWNPTKLTGTLYYFNALAKDYLTSTIFAGGSTNENYFGLFGSSDGGESWYQIAPIPTVMLKGISSLQVVVSSWCCERNLYVGTLGDGIYTYHLKVIDEVLDENQDPLQFHLSQNYPNPFNPTTAISYVIPKSSFVVLKVFDVLGNEVSTLVNENKLAGSYAVYFNIKDLPEGKAGLSSGIYFYKLQVDNYIQTRKMTILK
ncbi:MAG: T9SS type A sorting domain-containing protein [Ignavibacteriales bacterium]|nr:T9SS type A sorting domain-containing protein [Ignavibacteriales bacterium]